MTARPHLASDPTAMPRPSVKVATVCEILEFDPSDVRRLVAAGELEAHGKGIRGIRVFLDSVRAYQDRKTKPLPPRAPALLHRPKARAPASSAAFHHAMAGLRAKGLA